MKASLVCMVFVGRTGQQQECTWAQISPDSRALETDASLLLTLQIPQAAYIHI